MLLHPFRSREDGTMPAGMVLMVVVAGLLVAGALNADAILRKSNAKGDGWRNDLAHLTASPSRWYSEKWPSTNRSCGQRWRARHAGMPPFTPNAFASYDAASTTLPPTAIGLPRRPGSNSCSTDA